MALLRFYLAFYLVTAAVAQLLLAGVVCLDVLGNCNPQGATCVAVGATTGTCNAFASGLLWYKVTLSGLTDATVEVFLSASCDGTAVTSTGITADGVY